MQGGPVPRRSGGRHWSTDPAWLVNDTARGGRLQSRIQKTRNFIQHPRHLLPMRNVPAIFEDHRPRGSLSEPGDSFRVPPRSKLIAITVEGQNRTTDVSQILIERPVRERW